MSVNARLALALLALGHDLRHSEPPLISQARPAAVPTPEDTASVIAELAEAWLEGTNRDHSTTD